MVALVVSFRDSRYPLHHAIGVYFKNRGSNGGVPLPMSATFGDEATDGQRSKILFLGSILEPTEHPVTISPAVRSIVEEAGAVLCYLPRPLQKPADTEALLERVAALGTEPAKVIISVAGEGHPQETLAATIRTLEGLGFGVVGALPAGRWSLDRRNLPKVPRS